MGEKLPSWYPTTIAMVKIYQTFVLHFNCTVLQYFMIGTYSRPQTLYVVDMGVFIIMQ